MNEETFEQTIEYRACELLRNLLNAHESITDLSYSGKNGLTEQQYYELLNRVLDLIEKGLRIEDSQRRKKKRKSLKKHKESYLVRYCSEMADDL